MGNILMPGLVQDVRYALRGFVARPVQALVIVATFALGLGATTAIFSVVNAALLRPLPYRDDGRLVSVWETRPRNDFVFHEASYPNFLDFRARTSAFAGLAGYGKNGFVLSGDAGAELISAGFVTPDFFTVLGVNAARGRVLSVTDDDSTVVLTDGVWRRRFRADPELVGRTLVLDGKPRTVVGVLPRSFSFAPLGDAEIYAPIELQGPLVTRRNLFWLHIVGRLAPGVTLEQARSDLGAVAASLAVEYPDANAGGGAELSPLRDEVVGKVRPVLAAILLAVALLLVIACVNVASLMLARGAGRRQEMAVRAALGARRGRLVRQLVTEAALLGVVGGALGALLATWGVDLLLSAIPAPVRGNLPYLADARIDGWALGFALALSLATGVLAGLLPALHASRTEAALALESRGTEPHRRRLREVLVAAEVAVTFALVAGAGLVARSLVAVLRSDPGFQAKGVLTVNVLLPDRPDPQIVLLHDRVAARLAALPGVSHVASTSQLPLSGGGNTIRFRMHGETQVREASIREISPAYFRTMGIPQVAGRPFDARDGAEAPPVVLVNQTFARMFEREVTGQTFVFTFAPDQPTRRIVGVVGDENVTALDAPAAPVIYVPHAQIPVNGTSFVVRGSTDPEALGPSVRAAVAEVDPAIVVYQVMTMEQQVDAAPWMFVRRFPALLVGVFAAMALLLAVVGVYGVVGYTVSQQTRDIGIRRALGATTADILAGVLSRSLGVVAVGIGLGLLLAVAVGQALRGLLYGVGPRDPLVLLLAAAGLGTAAAVAAFLPARRAARIDPMQALR